MKQAADYLDQFWKARTTEERQDVVVAYQAFYQTLTPEERTQADKIMSVLWPSIDEKITELEPLMARLETLLSKKEIAHTA